MRGILCAYVMPNCLQLSTVSRPICTPEMFVCVSDILVTNTKTHTKIHQLTKTKTITNLSTEI